jgi:hypothetical protein
MRRKIIVYILYRVPECLSLRRNWVPPPPLPQASVSPTLVTKKGEQPSLGGEGVGGPIRTTAQKAWHSTSLCYVGNPGRYIVEYSWHIYAGTCNLKIRNEKKAEKVFGIKIIFLF